MNQRSRRPAGERNEQAHLIVPIAGSKLAVNQRQLSGRRLRSTGVPFASPGAPAVAAAAPHGSVRDADQHRMPATCAHQPRPTRRRPPPLRRMRASAALPLLAACLLLAGGAQAQRRRTLNDDNFEHITQVGAGGGESRRTAACCGPVPCPCQPLPAPPSFASPAGRHGADHGRVVRQLLQPHGAGMQGAGAGVGGARKGAAADPGEAA